MTSDSMAISPENHQMLVGVWKCDVTLPAMAGQKAATHHPTMTISVAPNTTLHIQFAAKQFMSDAFVGQDTKSKIYWLTTTDTIGDTDSQTSTGGSVYTGTSSHGGRSTPIRDAFARISYTKLRDVTEFQEHGKWTQDSAAVCTKT